MIWLLQFSKRKQDKIFLDRRHPDYDVAVIRVSDVRDFIKEFKETEIDLRDYGLTYDQGVKVCTVMNNFIDNLARRYLT